MAVENPMNVPESNELSVRISSLLASLTTMTLATVDQSGEPCAAAVYYAHDDDLTFYFISAKTTLHGANLLSHPRVAAAAYDEHQEWKSLSGLQISGVARPVELLEFPHAATVYTKKYPFVSMVTKGSPVELLKAMTSMTLWKYVPDWIRMTDNSRGFGFMEELHLDLANVR